MIAWGVCSLCHRRLPVYESGRCIACKDISPSVLAAGLDLT